MHKRFSEPFHRANKLLRAKLLVEPAPNLVALKSQLEGSKEVQVVTDDKLTLVSVVGSSKFLLVPYGDSPYGTCVPCSGHKLLRVTLITSSY